MVRFLFAKRAPSSGRLLAQSWLRLGLPLIAAVAAPAFAQLGGSGSSFTRPSRSTNAVTTSDLYTPFATGDLQSPFQADPFATNRDDASTTNGRGDDNGGPPRDPQSFAAHSGSRLTSTGGAPFGQTDRRAASGRFGRRIGERWSKRISPSVPRSAAADPDPRDRFQIGEPSDRIINAQKSFETSR